MLIKRETVTGTPIESLTKGSEQRVALCCDTCGTESETSFANYAGSVLKRGDDPWSSPSPKTYCRTCSCKRTGRQRLGKPGWNKGKNFPHLSGPNSAAWNGGSYIDSNGYRMVYDQCRPKSGSGWSRYIKEHVAVMEAHLGCKLRKGDVVHHIDGDKLNNAVTNLYLTNHAGHMDTHQSLQEIGYQLIRAGLITFDVEKGKYVAHVKLCELLEHPNSPDSHNVTSDRERDGLKMSEMTEQS